MSIQEKKNEMVNYVTKMVEQMPASDIAEMLAEFDPAMVARIFTADLPDPGPALLPGEDGVVEAASLSPLEVIIPTRNNLLPAHFLEEGAVVQRAVFKVIVPGQWMGSGFMVGRDLMLTNNHVLPSASIANTGQALFNFQATYNGAVATTETFTYNPASVFYTNAALDFTLVRVRPNIIWVPVLHNGLTPEDEAPVTSSVTLPPILLPHLRPVTIHAGDKYGFIRLRKNITYVLDAFLNIIQHPRGRQKEVALQDNNLTAVFPNVVRYQTDTEPGSSGSPVFDNAWDVVALHHASGTQNPAGVFVDNEGMRIDKIAADLVAHFTGLAGGAAVLAELGL